MENKEVVVRVKAVDENEEPVAGARCAVMSHRDKTFFVLKSADENGIAEETVRYEGEDVPVVVRVRLSSPGRRYVPEEVEGRITSDGCDLTVMLQHDRFVVEEPDCVR